MRCPIVLFITFLRLTPLTNSREEFYTATEYEIGHFEIRNFAN